MSDILEYWIIALNIIILVILVRGMMLLPKVQGMVEKMATDLMNKKIKELWEHRDDFKAPIEQMIQEIGKDMTKGKAGQPGAVSSIMAGNMEIPLGFLPKKYQGLAQMAMMFFGKKGGGNSQGGSDQGNPFDK